MESNNHTRRQGAAPDTFPDDYLPDSSPRPKYVIATIYPPSRESSVVPDRKPGSVNGEIPVPVQLPHETVSKAHDVNLPGGPEGGIMDTGLKEASLGIPTGRVSGAGSGSADLLLRSPVTTGTAGLLSKSSSLAIEPSAKKSLSLMELPRGKFRALKRNISLISLLRILQTHAFRGSCRINRDGSTILLVFDRGKIILAGYSNLAGEAALNMIYTDRSARVDAIISDLDDAQIRLSLEFNPAWKVQEDQDPSGIAVPGRRMNAGRKYFLPKNPVPEPDPGTYQEAACAVDTRPVYREAQSPGPAQSPAAGELNPMISANPGEEVVPGEQIKLPGPEREDTPDWRKAILMPLISSRDENVSSVLPEPGMPEVREIEVDWRTPPSTPRVSHGSGEAIQKPHETGDPEGRGEVEGWKRALYPPVIAALPEEKPASEQTTKVTPLISAGIPEFEPLSADSGLFDEIPVGKKLPKAPAPEPSEQWKSMGMNRGENSSV